ncbi:MAG: lipoprotein signal peptidase [Xanthomonadales bacterium]|nr:lipoprotein signal peptidase [Xanthomonadales bacterium]
MNEKPTQDADRRPLRPFDFPPISWAWLLVSAMVIVLDWQTKQLASYYLQLYRSEEVFSWLNITLAHNYGAAFSFLADAGGWQRWFFVSLASVISVVLLVWLVRLPRREWATALGLALILGGAIGNVVDRVRLGYVVDFIDVHFGGWHYPAFNVADSAITCGVILLLVDAIVLSRRREGDGA